MTALMESVSGLAASWGPSMVAKAIATLVLMLLAVRLARQSRASELYRQARRDLAQRVAAVLEAAEARGRVGRVSGAAILLVSSAVMIGIAPLDAVGERQERPPETPSLSFEVASVRHNTSGSREGYFNHSPRRFSASNIQLQALIVTAYGVDTRLARFLVVGGTTLRDCPSNCSRKEEVLAAHFDVDAVVPAGAPPDNESLMLMLRALLAERFNLKARFETREIPVYALTVAREGRLGPRLRPSDVDCVEWQNARRAGDTTVPEPRDARGGPLCSQRVDFSQTERGITTRRYAGPISILWSLIQNDVDRFLIDRTGLTGNFEWELTSEIPGLRSFVPDLEPAAPPIAIAIEEQLGLRLVPQMAAVDVLVIESVEMPTPN